MILVLAFGASVAWGLVRGGRLARVADLRLHHNWLVLAALALQVYSVYVLDPKERGPFNLQVLLLTGTYLLLLGYLWTNRRVPGIWLLGLGLAANFAVMLGNGGFMPVTREALAAAGYGKLATTTEIGAHVLATKDILLPYATIRGWILADIFVLPPPFPIPSVFSLGDVVIAAGTFFLVQHAMNKPTLALQAGGR